MTQAGDPGGFYEALGLSRTASAEEVRAAFRERAKRFHPDGAGSSPEDEARFLHLREAYETLRDPQRRMRYDAEGLGAGGNGAAAGEASGGHAEAGAGTGPRRRGGRHGGARGFALGLLRRWRRDGRLALAAGAALLALPLLGASLVAPIWARLDRQDRVIADLREQLRHPPQAPAASPDTGSTPELENGATVRRVELVFPRGSAELAATHGERAAAAVRRLRGAAGGLAPGEAWTVLVTGQARQPIAVPAAGALGAWELTLRRLAAATDLLVREGVPAERITARFQAGPSLPGEAAPSLPEAIQLTLLCCGGDGGSAAAPSWAAP